MDRPIIVPRRRLDMMGSPGYITSETFASSPLFLRQFQNHNGIIDSITLESRTEAPVIKPRTSLSPQYNNNTFEQGVAVPLPQPAPRTRRTIFFNEEELQVEQHLGLTFDSALTPIPKPRPRSELSPLSFSDSSGWEHVSKIAPTFVDSSPVQYRSGHSYSYCKGSTGKRKIPVDQDDNQRFHSGHSSNYSQRNSKKPRQGYSGDFCNIL